MTNYSTSKALRTRWFGRLCLTSLLVLATLYFTNAQPCPTTPIPGSESIPLQNGNIRHVYPSALPAGVTTGSPNTTHGTLYHDGNKGTATPLTTVTIHPQWSDGTMGWAVINLYYLEIASSGAVINIYNGEGTSTTPVATITSANASTYYRFNHKNNGPITVTMENTATAATGNFDVGVTYMTGEVVATSPFGQEFTYWKHFITPNSRAYIDSRAGNSSTIATGYFDTNKDLVSSELSWCVDYGQSAPRRGNQYPGAMVYYPTARPDINEDGIVTTEDKLKTARLIHILQNAPMPISDPNNYDAVRAAVDDITHWGTGIAPLAAAAIAAIPSLPSPEEPVFSITGPASPVLPGTAQNFVVNLTEDGGHPRVYTLKLPAGVTLNSVTGAGVTYNTVGQTITFASSPASATVNVTSLTSQTATVGIAYEQTGFWNVSNLIIYEPCDTYNVPGNNYQGFLGLSKAENPYPFREAAGTWDASLPIPFICTNLVYQVSGSNLGNSSLYSYNVSTGSRTLIGDLGSRINAIGYNTLDNFIWGINVVTNQAVKIGSNASLTAYTIPNLPAPDVTAYYNVGEVFGDGYLFIYSRQSTKYFVIDINPSRPGTYLKLVDPTAGFTEDVAPYGNTFTGANNLDISDLTYNSSNGLFYGIIDPQSATNKYRMFTINPVTRQVSISASTIAGGNIQVDESTAFGSAFIDPTNNAFYVFSNTLGKFYKINTTTLAATLLSTAPTGGANNNDGASCPTAFLTASISGNVFHDPNGGNVNNSTGTTNAVPAGLFANLVNTSGNVVASVPINSAGGYGFDGTAPGTYTVVLSATNGTIGNPAPSPSLPAGWVNTGEFNGDPNTGNTAEINGISAPFTLGSTGVDNVNFGIQQPPVAGNGSNSASNPGGTTQVAVPANTFSNTTASSDPDGDVSFIRLTGFPAGAASVVINGVTYSANVPTDVTSLTSLLIPTDENGTPSWSISADPENVGNTAVAFSFKSIDNAGTESTNTGAATLNLTAPLTISGSVLNDADGLSSPGNTVDGTPIQSASGTPLHANLFTSAGIFVATVPLDASGNYSFPASANTDYIVTICSTPATSSSTPATSVGLPAGWVNSGENIGSGAGDDGTPDGILPVNVATSDITNANFGIDREPNTNPVTNTLSSQPTVDQELFLDGIDSPLMNGNDPEDGTYSGGDGSINDPQGVVITSLPTNGQLWYYGFGFPVLVTATDIANGVLFNDPSLFSIILTGSGYTSTSFQYAYVDAAGVADPTPATYTIGWGGPLPVTLINFNAYQEGHLANLKWTTASEANSKGFEIERSADATNWRRIGSVASQNSNNNTRLNYNFIDAAPLTGNSYYRLKMVDQDGTYAYSKIRALEIKGSEQHFTAYPNPVLNGKLTIVLPDDGSYEAEVHNLAGIRMLRESLGTNKELDVSGLSTGAYLLHIKSADGTSQNSKFIVK